MQVAFAASTATAIADGNQKRVCRRAVISAGGLALAAYLGERSARAIGLPKIDLPKLELPKLDVSLPRLTQEKPKEIEGMDIGQTEDLMNRLQKRREKREAAQ